MQCRLPPPVDASPACRDAPEGPERKPGRPAASALARVGPPGRRGLMAALTIYLVIVPGLTVSLGQSLRSTGIVFALTHVICTFGGSRPWTA